MARCARVWGKGGVGLTTRVCSSWLCVLFVAMFTEGADPLHKATIVPRCTAARAAAA